MITTSRYVVAILFIVFATSSCTIEKRRFRDGYYIQWNKSGERTSDNNMNANNHVNADKEGTSLTQANNSTTEVSQGTVVSGRSAVPTKIFKKNSISRKQQVKDDRQSSVKDQNNSKEALKNYNTQRMDDWEGGMIKFFGWLSLICWFLVCLTAISGQSLAILLFCLLGLLFGLPAFVRDETQFAAGIFGFFLSAVSLIIFGIVRLVRFLG